MTVLDSVQGLTYTNVPAATPCPGATQNRISRPPYPQLVGQRCHRGPIFSRDTPNKASTPKLKHETLEITEVFATTYSVLSCVLWFIHSVEREVSLYAQLYTSKSQTSTWSTCFVWWLLWKTVLWLAQVVFSYFVLHKSRISLVLTAKVTYLLSLLFRQEDGVK